MASEALKRLLSQNDPEAPPPPPDEEPLQQLLWLLKFQLIFLMPMFKRGAFVKKVNWSVPLAECFDILLKSPKLDKVDKSYVLRVLDGIDNLRDELRKDGQRIGCLEMMDRDRGTVCAFVLMVQLDLVTRGEQVISEELRDGVMASLSFEKGKGKGSASVKGTRPATLGVIEEETVSEIQALDGGSMQQGRTAKNGESSSRTTMSLPMVFFKNLFSVWARDSPPKRE